MALHTHHAGSPNKVNSSELLNSDISIHDKIFKDFFKIVMFNTYPICYRSFAKLIPFLHAMIG